MSLSVEQVLALASDEKSVAAARKLAAQRNWLSTGQSLEALWGECRGSGVYQVQVELATLAYKCNCPSRKFPCKHVVGLLMVAAATPDLVPEAETPDWVRDWLAKRAATKAKQQDKAAKKPVDKKAQAKRAEKRMSQVTAGLEAFQLWLADIVRGGLATLEMESPSFWEQQAARLVDAKAQGLATRLRKIGTLPGSGPDWPQQLLTHFGRLALVLHAFRRLDQLEPALQDDLKQYIGWTINQDELDQRGEQLRDTWFTVGQWIDDEDRLRMQRTWLLGEDSGRWALVLQFSALGQPFAEDFRVGARQEMDLLFYPSAYPQRARVSERHGEAEFADEPFPAVEDIAAFLDQAAQAQGQQPWLETIPCLISEVVPLPVSDGRWLLKDRQGAALPLTAGDHWRLAALSGGHPLQLAGEWNGHWLLPLTAQVDGETHLLWSEAGNR